MAEKTMTEEEMEDPLITIRTANAITKLVQKGKYTFVGLETLLELNKEDEYNRLILEAKDVYVRNIGTRFNYMIYRDEIKRVMFDDKTFMELKITPKGWYYIDFTSLNLHFYNPVLIKKQEREVMHLMKTHKTEEYQKPEELWEAVGIVLANALLLSQDVDLIARYIVFLPRDL